MPKKETTSYSLAEMKDKYIGKAGAKVRKDYEYELRMNVFVRMIKAFKALKAKIHSNAKTTYLSWQQRNMSFRYKKMSVDWILPSRN